MSDHQAIVKGYKLGEVLGKGTQGTVFRARRGTQEVAVKVVQKAKLNKTARDNIVTEIGLLKKLRHKFIVELIDFHWDDRYIYIVTELCSGGDLSSIIRQKRCLPEEDVQKFLQQLSSALLYLRDNNVSHMDLKPSNLLISGTNPSILKLGDFGMAQHLAEDSVDKGLKGSPLYMAPEILTNDRYTAKADLWSIGVILYEALFGKAPFSSDTLEELVAKIKGDSPVVIPKTRKLSSDCRHLLGGCLVRDPEKRIEFHEFFQHSFLDLKHLPDEDSFKKASNLVNMAVEADKEKNNDLALELYEKSIKYFLPLLYYEQDPVRKSKLKKTVDTYIRRTNELKGSPDREMTRVDQLITLCRNRNPDLATGLEICLAGEQYQREGKLRLALDKLTVGLGILVPGLNKEPKGKRRELLAEVVSGWMDRGENIKKILKVNDNDISRDNALEDKKDISDGQETNKDVNVVNDVRQTSSCSVQ